jgi:hypothetical protein
VEEHLLREPLTDVTVGTGKIATVQLKQVVDPNSCVAKAMLYVVGLKRW